MVTLNMLKQQMRKKKKSDDNVDKLKAEIEKKDNEIQSLKVKAETEKAKVAKKETEKMVNPETGVWYFKLVLHINI